MKPIRITLYILFSLLIISCGSEEITIKLDSEDPRLVVEGYVTTNQAPFYVVLSLSSEYFSNEEAPTVSGADVTISDGTKTYNLHETSNGVYKTVTSYQGVTDTNYKLTISGLDIDGDGEEEEYTAESYLYPENPLDSVSLEYAEESGAKYWKVRIWATDDGSLDNFYAFKTYTPLYDITPNISDIGLVSDKFFNGNDVVGTDVIWFLEEDSDGDSAEYKPQLGDTIIVEMDGITEDYYDFLSAVSEETTVSTPIFSGPSANVPTNISNNALGFFTAYSVSRDTVFVNDSIISQRENY